MEAFDQSLGVEDLGFRAVGAGGRFELSRLQVQDLGLQGDRACGREFWAWEASLPEQGTKKVMT